MIEIPARKGKAVRVIKGQRIKVINSKGQQVVDTWAFNADDMREFMSMEHSRVAIGRIIPRIGDALDHRTHIGVARHLARQRYGLAAGRIYPGDSFAGGFDRDIRDRDARALAGEGESSGAADPAASARDQRRFPFEQAGHRFPPFAANFC